MECAFNFMEECPIHHHLPLEIKGCQENNKKEKGGVKGGCGRHCLGAILL